MGTMVFAADADGNAQEFVGVRFFGGTARGRTFAFAQPMRRMEGWSRFVDEAGRQFDRAGFTDFVRAAQTVEFAEG